LRDAKNRPAIAIVFRLLGRKNSDLLGLSHCQLLVVRVICKQDQVLLVWWFRCRFRWLWGLHLIVMIWEP